MFREPSDIRSQRSARPLRPIFVAGLIGSMLAGVSAAADDTTMDDDVLSRLGTRSGLEITLGAWVPRLEGDITLGEGGTALNAGADLSLDDSRAIFSGELEFETDRWRFLAGAYVIRVGGDGALQQRSVIDGRQVAAGTTVSSQVDVWSINGEASWAFFTPLRAQRFAWSDPRPDHESNGFIDLSLELVGGARILNIDQQYDVSGLGRVGSNRAWVSPYVGVGCRIDWSTRRSIGLLERIEFDFTSGWGPAFAGGTSTFMVRTDVSVYVTTRLAVTLGYQLNDWNVTRNDTTFDGGLQGLYAGLRYHW